MNPSAAKQQTSLATGDNNRTWFDGSPGTVVSSRVNPAGSRTQANRLAVHPSPHRLNSELWRLVLTDKLTGLCNQHGFIALADQQWRVGRRQSRELVFVGLELANLRDISENQPRGESDLAVMAAGRILMKSFRRSDVVCRWNGGEFRVLAVEAEGLDEAMQRSRIQQQVKNAGAPASYPMVFKGRVTRLNPQIAASFADILALVEEDLAENKRAWCGSPGTRPSMVLHDAQQ